MQSPLSSFELNKQPDICRIKYFHGNRDLNQSETLLFEFRIVDKVVLFCDLQRFLQKHIPLFHNILTHNKSTFNDSLSLTVIKIHTENIKMITLNYFYC